MQEFLVALMRIKGADTATAISEYFRDQGYRVNLMMDSVTRVAMDGRTWECNRVSNFF